jgi:kumamolisin
VIRRQPKEIILAALAKTGEIAPAYIFLAFVFVYGKCATFLVGEVLRAYNADGLSVTGKGQTIAILIDTVPADSDLKLFWKWNNLPISLNQVVKINVKGGPLPSTEGEETLDVSWASGIAPGATVRVYASGSLQFVDLDRTLDPIIADLPSQSGMRQLSISLGLAKPTWPRRKSRLKDFFD